MGWWECGDVYGFFVWVEIRGIFLEELKWAKGLETIFSGL